jgi:hypothetical protein
MSNKSLSSATSKNDSNLKNNSNSVSKSDEIYDKYLDQIRDFYILKKRYEKYKESTKKKIIESDNLIDVKKRLLAKTKFKCINCKNEGGTIFEINNTNLKAFCGNKVTPCDLNINISKKKFTNLKDDLLTIEDNINIKKKEIILSKLNYIFKYIEEDKAVENFEKIKSELTELQREHNKLFEKYVNIYDNENIKINLEELLVQQHTHIIEFKDILDLYYNTKENKYLNNAISYYITNIISIDEKILNKNYKYNAIEKDPDNDYKYLIQENYLHSDSEILIHN